jgi:beta-1,4-N-acetylglucosaminyltransferase
MRIEFIESFTCVEHMSLTGKLLYHLRIADFCYVQWISLQKKYPKSRYIGVESRPNLPYLSTLNLDSIEEPKRWVFISVGSTKFDALIQALDSEKLIELLRNLGFIGIRFQIGKGTIHPKKIEDFCTKNNFKFECFGLKASVLPDMKHSSLMICHAGAGTITEGLKLKKRMLVVPNPLLMNNHQLQLAENLAKQNFLRFVTLEKIKDARNLFSAIQDLLQQKIQEFPELSSTFVENLKDL